ncbi:MAG: IclR family transcriptional regulator [Halorhabdus sp.]
MNETRKGKWLETTGTSLKVLRALKELDGATISEVADHLDRPKSTVLNHLVTLAEARYAVEEEGEYYPALGLLDFGEYVRHRKPGYDLAEQYTEQLTEETGLRSIFVVEEHGRGVFLHTKPGEHSDFRHERLGNVLYLHDTAVGKALLAELPAERVERILDRWGLPAETDNTITDRETLLEELDAVRERGYALNYGENIEGLNAVGVAVSDEDDGLLGAFSVSGAKRQLSGTRLEEAVPQKLLGVANEFELELSLS